MVSIFINKINAKVKLVGTTIACLPPNDIGGHGPKVEGFFFATDKVGLEIIEKEKTVFQIHNTKYSAVVNGEYALTNCIMRNGYSIDCMIRKYQGIDWSNKRNWNMNNNKHPSRKYSFYGSTLNPYELIFHKWHWGWPGPYYDPGTCNFEIIQQYVDNKC